MRDRKKKAETDCRTWPVWDNYRYAFSWLKQSKGAGVFVILAVDGMLQVLVPFLGMALPSAVIGLLTGGRKPEERLLLICGYLLLFQILTLMGNYFGKKRLHSLFLFRLDSDKAFFSKCLEVDDQLLESAAGQRKMEMAIRNIYSGNEVGVEAFLNHLLNFFINLGGMTVYAVVIGQNSLLLLAGLLLLTGLTAAVQYRAGVKGAEISENGWKLLKRFFYLLVETIKPANGKDIRLYRMKKWFERVFELMSGRAVENARKEWTCYLHAGAAEKMLSFLRDGIIYGCLIAQMARGSIGLSRFLLYIGIVAGFGGWMTGLVTAIREIMKNNGLMDRYRDFMEDGKAETAGKEKVHAPGYAHEIRLEHVSFRYEGQKEDALHDLNLTIKTGEKLALVGMNGAGKTTLVKLICGLFRPASGKIYLDGQDISGISKEAYFQEFSVVFQDVFAFSFSLEDNVSCAEADRLDCGKLEDCLKKADLWERVEGLERGSKTVMNKDLDESGVTLSGGELQKLMLARALYKNAPVVILDEPTAALDPLAESAMYEKYYELTRDKTSLFISHRLSSTRFCDRIIFLENGKIAEEGSHEALMAKKGVYARMFETQAQYYREEEEACRA